MLGPHFVYVYMNLQWRLRRTWWHPQYQKFQQQEFEPENNLVLELTFLQ